MTIPVPPIFSRELRKHLIPDEVEWIIIRLCNSDPQCIEFTENNVEMFDIARAWAIKEHDSRVIHKRLKT